MKKTLADINQAVALPMDEQLEQTVLGSVIFDARCYEQVASLINEGAFYSQKHQLIWRAIVANAAENIGLDILTVIDRLRKDGGLELVGGSYYVSTLTATVGSTANIEQHCLILKQFQVKREMYVSCRGLSARALDMSEDPLQLLADLQTEVQQIADGAIRKQALSSFDLHRQVLKRLDGTGTQEGLSSGLTELDAITGCFQKSDLIILAARPSMGKTSLALCIATHVGVVEKKPVLVLSLEMSSQQLVMRQQSFFTGVPLSYLRKRKLSDAQFQQLHAKVGILADAPIYFDDAPGMTLTEVTAKLKYYKAKFGIELVVLDYLQLINAKNEAGKGSNREQEVSTISRALKQSAKALDVPLIALCQLSRAVEQRGGDKKPHLSDLRDSGAIEQDADVVMFIHRPDYYGITTDESGNSISGLAKIIVSKHRNGSLGEAVSKFEAETTGFFNNRVELPAPNYNPRIVRDYSMPMKEQDIN